MSKIKYEFNITSFCDTWGLKINQKKTFVTIFTNAGLKSNYFRTYDIKIRLGDTIIPLEPHPTFLGITLDPKLNLKKHLSSIVKKLTAKVNIFKKLNL